LRASSRRVARNHPNLPWMRRRVRTSAASVPLRLLHGPGATFPLAPVHLLDRESPMRRADHDHPHSVQSSRISAHIAMTNAGGRQRSKHPCRSRRDE
jgi:hypothetical protein